MEWMPPIWSNLQRGIVRSSFGTIAKAHLNMKDVYTLQYIVSDMNLSKFSCPTSSLFCEACIEDKQHRVAFLNERGWCATKSSEIVHFDVCGPMKTTSMDDTNYFVTFIDILLRRCDCIC